MRVPLSWIQLFLTSFRQDSDVLAEHLTSLGLEVDAVHELSSPGHGVIVAEVLDATPHPHLPELTLLQLSTGRETGTVVTRLQGLSSGMRVAWARVGASLCNLEHPVERQDFGDISSEGRLASYGDLGMEPAEERITLSREEPLGRDLTRDLTDTVLELSLTPNLGHCLSILGIARELAASGWGSLHDPLVHQPPLTTRGSAPTVTVATPGMCPLYSLSHLVCKTPPQPMLFQWQARLHLCGLRTLSPWVDATNLVLLERGQPMHVFDPRATEAPLTIRMGGQQETLELLNGRVASVEHQLIIADAQGPVALGGVMGGVRSAVQPGAQAVWLEAALFDPTAVRKASKATGVRSDSSIRFERQVDPAGMAAAVARFVEFLQLECSNCIGTTVVGSLPERNVLQVTPAWIVRQLGAPLEEEALYSLLQDAGCTIVPLETAWEVTPPSWRNDLVRPIDLVEEVARLIGYAHLPRPAPRYTTSLQSSSPRYLSLEHLRAACIGVGLQEWITTTLVSAEGHALSRKPAPPRLLNAASTEHCLLRSGMLEGMLQALAHNQARRWKGVAAFEVGSLFSAGGSSLAPVTESLGMGIVCYGQRSPQSWQHPEVEWDFFTLKGLCTSIWEALRIGGSLRCERSAFPWLHPHRQAALLHQEREIGFLGALHPEVVAKRGLSGPVWVCEWDLESMLQSLEKAHAPPLAEPPTYPGTYRDLTLELPWHCEAARLTEGLEEVHLPGLQRWEIISVFPKPAARCRAISWRFYYRDVERTLTAVEVDATQALLVEKLTAALASVQD